VIGYSSVGIYLDTVNIFIRIAMILAGGGGSRRKWSAGLNGTVSELCSCTFNV